MNSREKLLSIKRKEKVIKIEGEKYKIIEMNGIDREDFERSLYKMNKGDMIYNTVNSKVRLIAYSLFSIDGERLFDPVKDLVLMNKGLSSSILSYIFDEATRMNKLNPEVEEKN